MKYIKIEQNYHKLVQGILGHNLLQTYNAKWMTQVYEWNSCSRSFFYKMVAIHYYQAI